MAFLWLIDKIVSIYILLIIIRAIISWFPDARYKYRKIIRWIVDVTDIVLVPCQRILPHHKTGGIDFSPVIAILGIRLIWQIILSIFI